jgi:hypothetical protein
MTSNFQTGLKILDDLMKNFLNHLIDQIIEINVQPIQIIQTEQKRSVDLYYMKSDDFKRNVQINEF